MRLYLFSILALLGLLALVFGFWFIGAGPNYHEDGLYAIFFTGLFITGTIFASISFNALGSKDKGIYWLSVPATHFEKLACTILYATIFFTIAYCACFYCIKFIGLSFLDVYMKKHPGLSYTKLTDFDNGFGGAIKYMIYAFFAIQSLYLLGSAYFRRYSFIVTTVVGALVIFAFVYILSLIHDNMFEGLNWNITSVRTYNDNVTNEYKLYAVSPTVVSILKYALQFAWAPVFWFVAWFRLKEKEI